MSDLTGGPLTSKSPHFDDAGARLTGEVRRVADLSAEEQTQMYDLLAHYFANTTRRQFQQDLAEKEWAILLRETATGNIQGFSTLMRL